METNLGIGDCSNTAGYKHLTDIVKEIQASNGL